MRTKRIARIAILVCVALAFGASVATADKMVRAKQAVILSDDITKQTNDVIHFTGVSGGTVEPQATSAPDGSANSPGNDNNRSGLGDGTNPGQGSGTANSPNQGTDNPNNAGGGGSSGNSNSNGNGNSHGHGPH